MESRISIFDDDSDSDQSSDRMLLTQSLDRMLLMQARLEETSRSRGGGSGDQTTSVSIFRCPRSLIGIMNDNAHLPELVSIGPYHRGEGHLLEFEKYKWYYLERHLASSGVHLSYCFKLIRRLEKDARECYSGLPTMPSDDFVQMMILDSCFVIQFLIGLGSSVDEMPEKFNENDPISTMPCLIPVLITDLLKLENQIPFFILDSLWPHQERDSLQFVALKVFNMLFQMPWDSTFKSRTREPKHLLDLFHLCFRPSNQNTATSSMPHAPSMQSIQCASKLSSSGMKFSSKKANSFLDIGLRGRALKIPSIIINDCTGSIILNCVALEQQRDQFTYFSTYVVFMKSLISEPKDVALLCSSKIITSSSKNDQFVVNFFNKLGEKIDFNIRDCYLSEEFSQLEAFYTSFYATVKRRHFSSSLTSIATFYAPTLLIFTVAQLILQFLQYRQH